jgi:hypothetical protein
MSATKKQIMLGLGLAWLTGLACAAGAFYLAACAGDVKGGHWGDPQRALELEGIAVIFSLIAWIMAGALASLAPVGIRPVIRSIRGIGVTTSGLIGMSLAVTFMGLLGLTLSCS